MLKTLKIRIYPDEDQKVLIEKHFGSTRFVWNHFLEKRTREYHDNGRSMSAFDTINDLKNMKKEYEWLNEINSQSFQQVLMKLDTAFRAFFKHNAHYPNFRSKKDNQYFIVPQHFSFGKGELHLPKFKRPIKFRDNATVPESINQIIVTRDVDRYYASIQYELNEDVSTGKGTIGALQLGLFDES